MYKSSSHPKVKFILKMIEHIETIIQRHQGITKALEDEVEARQALLMSLMQIGENMNKIDNDLLVKYDLSQEAKGSYDVRNFIAHDYEGVNLILIEGILRESIPLVADKFRQILKEFE